MTIRHHAIVVGLIGAVAAAPNLLAPIRAYDGGLAGSAGTFILHGAVPYRDFWWLYGPAAPVVAAIATALFGPSLLLLRVLGLGIVAMLTGFVYRALRYRLPHGPAAMMSIGATSASTVFVGLEISSWSLALVLALAGLIARGDGVDRRHSAHAGVLVGMAFLARLDVGAYALLAGLIAGDRRRFLAGFAATSVPLASVIGLTTPLSDLIEQLVWFPLVGTRQFRALPPPPISDGVDLLAFLALAVVPKLAVAIALMRIVRGDRTMLVLGLSAFGALCQLQTLGRSDFAHQAQAAIPGYLVLGLIGAGAFRRGGGGGAIPRREARRRLASFAGLAAACALSLTVGAFSLRAAELGALGAADRGLVAGIRTVMLNTAPTDRLFVGLASHRITLLNDMLAYYLADRRSAVRDAMFNPGVTNTDRIQAEMVTQIGATGTELLLLNDLFALMSEPSNDSVKPGSRILDAEITREFVEVCRFGPIAILAKRSSIGPVHCAEERPDERLIDVLSGL